MVEVDGADAGVLHVVVVLQVGDKLAAAVGADECGGEDKLLADVLVAIENGEVLALEQGNHSFYAPNFRLAVIYDLRLNRCLSLRVMPGVKLLDYQWEPGIAVVNRPSIYKLESVCGELPVDIKLHPFRKGNFEPFVLGGIVYGFDFTSLRNDIEGVSQMNAHDFRCNFGIGVDCYTPILKLGVELKAGFGIIQPNTTSNDNPFYFKNGPTFSLGVSIEA